MGIKKCFFTVECEKPCAELKQLRSWIPPCRHFQAANLMRCRSWAGKTENENERWRSFCATFAHLTWPEAITHVPLTPSCDPAQCSSILQKLELREEPGLPQGTQTVRGSHFHQNRVSKFSVQSPTPTVISKPHTGKESQNQLKSVLFSFTYWIKEGT